MKNSIILFLLIAFNSLNAQTVSKADISFNSTSHDFKTIPMGKPVTYVYKFKNTGTDMLTISAVNPSCGCTTPVWPKKPIMPGATDSIVATYNAAAVGAFNKTITVLSNAKNAQVVLSLTGDVKQ